MNKPEKKKLNDIEKIIRDFWWGDTKEKRKLHWISWENLKVEKGEGGMGFKDLRSFNIAMLAKQAWRLLTNPDTLLGTIMAHKYYRNGTILSAKSSDRVSFAFRSILAGRDLLEKGLLWRIGDGRSIECFKDRWLPRPNEYRPISKPPSEFCFRVFDFIVEGEWDVQKLREVFLGIDVDLITSLTIPLEERPDDLSWIHSQSGVYTVSSGYRLHRSLVAPQPESSTGWDRKWLRHLWNLKMSRKVSVPVWRAWKDSLPVAINVRHRGLSVPRACSFCEEEAETSEHLFMHYPLAVVFWQAVLPSPGRKAEMSNLKEWIEHVYASENLAFRQIFAVTIWVLWFHKNNIHFKGEKPNHTLMTDSIRHHLGRFLRDSPSTQSPEVAVEESETSEQTGWVRPAAGWVKVNCDASVVLRTGEADLECVIQNELGEFFAGKSIKQVFNPSVLLMELRAITQGMVLTKEVGCRKVKVEFDCLVAIDLLTGKVDEGTQFYSREIKEEVDFCRGFSPWFEACSFLHTHRSGNSLAHAFAKHELEVESSILFTEKPDWAIEVLHGVSEPVGD